MMRAVLGDLFAISNTNKAEILGDAI